MGYNIVMSRWPLCKPGGFLRSPHLTAWLYPVKFAVTKRLINDDDDDDERKEEKFSVTMIKYACATSSTSGKRSMVTWGAFHLSELISQTIPVAMRISLLINSPTRSVKF